MKNDPRSCERKSYSWVRSMKRIQDFNGIEPVTSRYRCDALTNWAELCSYVLVKEMNVTDVHEINHIRNAQIKSNEELSSQLVRASPREVSGSTLFFFFFFSGFLRNCINCNREDHSSFDFILYVPLRYTSTKHCSTEDLS